MTFLYFAPPNWPMQLSVTHFAIKTPGLFQFISLGRNSIKQLNKIRARKVLGSYKYGKYLFISVALTFSFFDKLK